MIESQVLEEAIQKVEQAANKRAGLGTALRALLEARSRDVCDEDGQFDYDHIVKTIEQLGAALADTVLALSGAGDLQRRMRALMENLVQVNIGERGDLNQMVALQAEASDILSAE